MEFRISGTFTDSLTRLTGEVCLIVRSPQQISRALAAAAKANLESVILTSDSEPEPTKASIATMHEAKGLEFRVVAVMACDDDVLPLSEPPFLHLVAK